MRQAIQWLNNTENEACECLWLTEIPLLTCWQVMHIEQIVMPNAAPYNKQTPATIFGAYTEASNQVTELGEDVVAIFHLLDYHHRIMDPLDAMLLNLHDWEDE